MQNCGLSSGLAYYEYTVEYSFAGPSCRPLFIIISEVTAAADAAPPFVRGLYIPQYTLSSSLIFFLAVVCLLYPPSMHL